MHGATTFNGAPPRSLASLLATFKPLGLHGSPPAIPCSTPLKILKSCPWVFQAAWIQAPATTMLLPPATTAAAPTVRPGMPTQMEMASVMPATANLLALSPQATWATAVTTVTTPRLATTTPAPMEAARMHRIGMPTQTAMASVMPVTANQLALSRRAISQTTATTVMT